MMTSDSISASFYMPYLTPPQNDFVLDVDLMLPGRGVTAVFGHSGSGKTTLLRCIAGLQRARKAQLIVKGEIWQDSRTCIPTHKRPLGYVFQEASLFAHLSARKNLDYAAKRSGTSSDPVTFEHAVSLLGIEPLLERYPSQLSGGERQRVAIARALLINPRLLLMDEPLAALDFSRKQEILPYLEQLKSELEIPILYISHSVDEVARLADHLVLLDNGKTVAEGRPADVMARLDLPVRLGEELGVVLDATVTERDPTWHLVRVTFKGGELWVRDGGDALGQAVRVRIQARDVSLALAPHRNTSILNLLAGEVSEVADDVDPAMSLVRMSIGSAHVLARITRRSADNLHLTPGRKIWAQIKSVAIVR